MRAEDLPPLDWDEEEVTKREGKIPTSQLVRREREKAQEDPPAERSTVYG